MRTIKLTVAYVGTNYRGFQKQPCGGTIQDILEEFLSQVCGEPVEVAASGRTDAGVHALGQVVSFKTNGTIPCKNLLRVAVSLLPRDIAILEAEEMPDGFHARFSSHSKEYEYWIFNDKGPDPFLVDRSWIVPENLDVERMNEAAKFVIGEHDFRAFCSTGSDAVSSVRTVDLAQFERKGKFIYFHIQANGFLYHMVRNLVWSLAQVGMGKRTVADFEKELQSQRTEFLNSPAPAEGLYLKKVNY